MCLLKDQGFETETVVEQITRNNNETLEDGITSYDLTQLTTSECGEMGTNQRLAQCTYADSKELCEIVHFKRNRTHHDTGDDRNNGTGTFNLNNDERIADFIGKGLQDPVDNETFLSQHLHSLIKRSRRVSKNFNSETEESLEDKTETPFTERLHESTHSVEMQFQTLEERCRYYWNTNSDSDDESDCDEIDISRDSEVSRDYNRSRDSLSELDETFSG